ncbi:AMP-dependent synthetase/ligase [Lewinella cohaerens]|uniref:AMP-dependent synthetase/ligase n=1 Tax=Lewinella cohaerens TaxID=70995 RepID=UPI000375913D|nr:long-chain fatty acid--CoA ligase [Lewinella cohaerens]
MEPTRLFDFIHYQKEHFPQAQAIGGRKTSGEWAYYSTDEVIEKANQVSRGLIALGVQPGDKIALVVYKNRPEWTIMDIGLQQIGAINVPVYPTISPVEYEYIFNDAGVKLCFAGEGDLYDKVTSAKPNVSTLENIYTLDRQEGRPYWEDIFAEGGQEEVEQRKAAIQPEEMATIIYTSGTTGNPKGVMLSHNNIVSNVKAVKAYLPLNTGEIALSFLPLCHIFERTAAYSFVYNGINIVFTGTDNLGGETGDLQAIKPHFFTTVPRLLEKVYEKIYNKGLDLTGLKKTLFFWALGLTDTYDYDKQFGGLTGIQWGIADKLIFSKWREALGGRVKGILTGAAPCPVKIMRVFSAAGIPIREAYGLTETSPGLTFNRYEADGAYMGTVGMPFPDVEIRIDTSGDYREGEGEIMAKGPNIMMGYYNKPDETAKVIEEVDGERWFRTGDVGTWVTSAKGNKFVKITDRKKELLKTSGGKYVAPAPIESLCKEDFLIEQMMVVGDKRKFVSALIVPSPEALENYCSNNGIKWTTLQDAVSNSKVIAHYQQIIDSMNPRFSKIEQIKKFTLLPTTWDATKEDGSTAELTPTMKLKRRVILEKFAKEIEMMYNV